MRQSKDKYILQMKNAASCFEYGEFQSNQREMEWKWWTKTCRKTLHCVDFRISEGLYEELSVTYGSMYQAFCPMSISRDH